MLQMLRTAIERYAIQHNGVPPGYVGNDPSQGIIGSRNFYDQLVNVGHYLSKMPKNPFNDLLTCKVLGDNDTDPGATGNRGWVYRPLTKEMRLDWPGVDSSGDTYYDY